jgi:hypothetical protein
MKRGLLFVAAAWLSLSMLTSALLLLDAWRLDHAANKAKTARLENQAKEARLLASAGGTAALKQRMQTVQTWHSINALDQNPGPLFQSVLNVSKQVGNLHIQHMEWVTGTTTTQRMSPTLIIEGEILPFDNDFRAAHQRVQNLVKALQDKLPASRIITVKRWPLDVTASSALEGEFGHSHVNARFQIEVMGLTQ